MEEKSELRKPLQSPRRDELIKARDKLESQAGVSECE
jgi:hypothetical protein